MHESGNISNPALLQGHLIGMVKWVIGHCGWVDLACKVKNILNWMLTPTLLTLIKAYTSWAALFHTKTKRCSLFSHFLPQPVLDPCLLHKHGTGTRKGDTTLEKNHPQGHCATLHIGSGRSKPGNLQPKCVDLLPRHTGVSWQDTRRMHMCTHMHASTYTPPPFFCSFWKGVASPQQLKTTKEALVQLVFSKQEKGGKEWKGVSKYNQERDMGRWGSWGRSGQGNGLVVGRRDGVRERRSWAVMNGEIEEHIWEAVATRQPVICWKSQIPPKLLVPVSRAADKMKQSLRDQQAPQKDLRQEKRGEREGEEEAEWEEGEGASEKRQQRPVGHRGDDFLWSWVCFLRRRQVQEWGLQDLNVQALLQR